ncbi:aldo/keto reductase [Methylobacterium persicinum]
MLAAMDGVAAAHGTTHEAIALAWSRQQRAVTSLIVGAQGVDQLDANLASLAITLSPSELALLGEAGALTLEYPGWMLAQSSAARADLLRTGEMPPCHRAS